jgi:DNA polymerase-4
MDLDAFFCAVEELNDPSLKNKPFAVGGDPKSRGVIASCSYAARKYGVHSAMSTAQALRLCPQLILVSSKFHNYRQKSDEVMEILGNKSAMFEQISIDEAFLDVSDLPEDGSTIAGKIKTEIMKNCGLSASFGVASNKLVAKIANDIGKKKVGGDAYPGAIQQVKPGKEAEFLAPLPVNNLWGVGEKTSDKLRSLGINRIGELADFPLNKLIQLFGKNGYLLKQHAQGIDNRPVESSYERKSISQEITFATDINDKVELIETLRKISDRLGYSLRVEKVMAQTIRLKFRLSDFSTFTRQKTLPQAINQDSIIFETAVQLLEQHWDNKSPLRLLGVGVSQLIEGSRQLSLWDTIDEKERKLLEAVDSLQDRYGRKVVMKASAIKKTSSEK